VGRKGELSDCDKAFQRRIPNVAPFIRENTRNVTLRAEAILA
jgi:hypothetical protein